MAGMEQFTQKARRVLSLAQKEAERMRKEHIGTEHILLGLMLEDGCIANRVLRDLGIDYDRVKDKVELETGFGDFTGKVTLALDTQRVLEFAIEEVTRSGQTSIGTEHILLALTREAENTAMMVLEMLGLRAEQIRRHTRRVILKPNAKPKRIKNQLSNLHKHQ